MTTSALTKAALALLFVAGWAGARTYPRHPDHSRTSMGAQFGPIGTLPLGASPMRLDFVQGDNLPSGVQTATVKDLPGGGVELYLRIPPGAKIPQHWQSSAQDLTFIRGETTVLSDGGRLLTGEPGGHISLPVSSAHELDCGIRAECLIFVRSTGPMSIRYLDPSNVPSL